MESLETFFSPEELPYTGRELRPHFIFEKFGLRGSAVGAFIGPCEVPTEHLVDWEDRVRHLNIRATQMVHFLGEFFGGTLKESVFCQRLWIAAIQQSLEDLVRKSRAGTRIHRTGNDLWVVQEGQEKRGKLSVSIVTASPVSSLLHIGINVDATGAPVAAGSLLQLGLPVDFIKNSWVPHVLEIFREEWKSVHWACAKVRPVSS